MAKYTMSAQVPKGKGDYGSDWLCVMNNEQVPTRQIAINVARRLSDAKNTRVMLWEGKRRLIWDSLVGPVTAETEYYCGNPVLN